MLQTTSVVFVSTELLTCSHIRHGRKIQHLLLQWFSVNRPSWWDSNYVGLHLFLTIERVKDVKYHDENSLSLHRLLSVNRPYLQSVLTITNSAFTFAVAQCEGPSWWDYNYVGLYLFMTIERVKDVKYHDENLLSLHQLLSVNRPYLQSVLKSAN